jgi:glutamate---cysteine ligase / carboxylate-amine ligase
VSAPKRERRGVSAADAEALRALFDHAGPPTFGVEEEVMLLDPQTFDLAPCAAELISQIGDRAAFKLELPASQLEIVSPVRDDLAQLARDLHDGRRRLAAAAPGVRIVAAGAHPFAAPEGKLNEGARYERMEREYGSVIRSQLICGLHVHIGLSGAERVLAVYNALRSYLPELAALAANAPMHRGRDSGLASVRPMISGTLPRQGVPPRYDSLHDYAADLDWGLRSGRLQSVGEWWWEMRLHPQLGTLEVRVADAQSRAVDAAAVVATVCGLALWLAERHDAGELAAPAASWRIAENRWSAARHGIHGEMLDLRCGTAVETRRRLHCLLEQLRPCAASVAGAELVDHAHLLAETNGADRQRAIAAKSGLDGLMEHLSGAFLESHDAFSPPR